MAIMPTATILQKVTALRILPQSRMFRQAERERSQMQCMAGGSISAIMLIQKNMM